MDRSLDLWNGLFHDGVIAAMAGQVPGDGTVTIQQVHDLAAIWEDSSLFYVERDGAFLVFDCAVGSLRIQYVIEEIFLDSGRPIRYEELEASVTRWWEEWIRRRVWGWRTGTASAVSGWPRSGGPWCCIRRRNRWC